ncbi:hypothetical protein [Sulfurimonas sp.]|uniref:hypothetical protein n=1 Tax=Sulfurimonas sp. TaxID=2022749 RepID=UPI001A0248B4|nr:hypothetical protein [Sulfurimonas sp.]MBE0515642.1 hypothetical protein [Sulfurimonas sp.]
MKRLILKSRIGVMSLVVAVSLTGCFEEKVRCNNDEAISLVKELIFDNQENVVFDNVLLMDRKRELKNEPTDNEFVTNMILNGQMDGMGLMAIQIQKGQGDSAIAKKYKLLMGEINSVKIAIQDIVTISKDKEINKVQCQASSNISYSIGTYPFDLIYTVQTTDDEKKLLVNIESFEAQ